MAKYPYTRTVRHKCGHPETYTLHCTHAAEANTQASNLSKCDCHACVTERVRVETELKLPPLRGSIKQVPWAVGIRLRLAAALNKFGKKDALDALRGITEARWFIDSRNLKLSDIIGKLQHS